MARRRYSTRRMASHTVVAQRRSGDTFSTLPVLGKVLPGEAIRYRVDGATFSLQVELRVLDALGFLIFDTTVQINAQGSGWVDTTAPTGEGPYTLTAQAHSFPGLPIYHFADVQFIVSVDAPPPPPEPPGGGLGDFRGLVIALAVLAGIIIIAPAIIRLIPGRR